MSNGMSNVRVLATDLEFPEGPVVMPDGSVVLVEIRGQRLTRVYPDGRKEVVAKVRANGVPVEYIIFPDAGHGFHKKADEITAYNAVGIFLDKYLKHTPAPRTPAKPASPH